MLTPRCVRGAPPDLKFCVSFFIRLFEGFIETHLPSSASLRVCARLMQPTRGRMSKAFRQRDYVKRPRKVGPSLATTNHLSRFQALHQQSLVRCTGYIELHRPCSCHCCSCHPTTLCSAYLRSYGPNGRRYPTTIPFKCPTQREASTPSQRAEHMASHSPYCNMHTSHGS